MVKSIYISHYLIQRKILFFISFVLFSVSLFAQTNDLPSGYTFTNGIDLDATEITCQYETGTCWSFATTSFIESELIRMGKGKHYISEMFFARKTYPEKASNYVRRAGKANFSEGALAHDVLNTIKKYGMVPKEAYSGLKQNEKEHNHRELVAVMRAYLNVIAQKRNPSSKWLSGIEGILDGYIGTPPEKFTYNQKEYTPITFRDELGINPDNYISITSFTHHPFYSPFILEVRDNFSNGSFWNVQLNEMVSIIDHALKNGYTLGWDADVSEKGFSKAYGIAVLPEEENKEEKEIFSSIQKEKVVSQTSRQIDFNTKKTTDDHLMHIVGSAKDQNGNKYYIVKNSWGAGNWGKPGWKGNGGRIMVSEAYIKSKTISITLHKNGVEKSIAKKINLK